MLPAEEGQAAVAVGGDVGPELAQLRAEALVDQVKAGVGPGPAAGAPPSPAAGEPAAPKTETVEEWRDSIAFLVDEFLVPAYPSLAKVYTPERTERLATAAHRVAVKHGWSLGSLFEKWKEEIALGMVTLPIARDTLAAIRGARSARPAAGGDGGSGGEGAATEARPAPAAGAIKFAE